MPFQRHPGRVNALTIANAGFARVDFEEKVVLRGDVKMRVPKKSFKKSRERQSGENDNNRILQGIPRNSKKNPRKRRESRYTRRCPSDFAIDERSKRKRSHTISQWRFSAPHTTQGTTHHFVHSNTATHQ